MKVLGEKTEVRVETSYKLAGIKCDVCGKIIEPPSIEDQYKWMEKPYTYYAVKTGHHDWGNDSIESIEERDICIDGSDELYIRISKKGASIVGIVYDESMLLWQINELFKILKEKEQ